MQLVKVGDGAEVRRVERRENDDDDLLDARACDAKNSPHPHQTGDDLRMEPKSTWFVGIELPTAQRGHAAADIAIGSSSWVSVAGHTTAHVEAQQSI